MKEMFHCGTYWPVVFDVLLITSRIGNQFGIISVTRACRRLLPQLYQQVYSSRPIQAATQSKHATRAWTHGRTRG